MLCSAQLLTATVFTASSLVQCAIAVSQGDDASDLRTVQWRLFDEAARSEVSLRLVIDAQAMLLRAAVLSFQTNKADEVSIASIAARAKNDFERIATARPGERYIPSQAMARADLGLAWLVDVEPNKSLKLPMALYTVGLAALARDAEERAINPEGIVLRYWDNTIQFEGEDWKSLRSVPADPSSPLMEKSDPANEPPEGTGEARFLVKQDLLDLAAVANVSAMDLNDLAAAFAGQSLGGVKYILEIRDRLAKDDVP